MNANPAEPFTERDSTGAPAASSRTARRVVATILGLILPIPAIVIAIHFANQSAQRAFVYMGTAEIALDALLGFFAGLVLVALIAGLGMISAIGPVISGVVLVSLGSIPVPMLFSLIRPLELGNNTIIMSLSNWTVYALMVIFGALLIVAGLVAALVRRRKAAGGLAITLGLIGLLALAPIVLVVVTIYVDSAADPVVRGQLDGSAFAGNLIALTAAIILIVLLMLLCGYSGIGGIVTGAFFTVVGLLAVTFPGILLQVIGGIPEGIMSYRFGNAITIVNLYGFVACFGVVLLMAGITSVALRRARRIIEPSTAPVQQWTNDPSQWGPQQPMTQ